MGAFHHVSAGAAGNKTGVPSSVDKKHTLLPFRQPVVQKLLQLPAENRAVSLFQLLSQIYDMNGRELSARQPFRQGKPKIPALLRPVKRF